MATATATAMLPPPVTAVKTKAKKMTKAEMDILFAKALTDKSKRPKGEFIDLTAVGSDTVAGYKHNNGLKTYGISTPLIKYIHELEAILSGPQDNKSGKRQERLDFLLLCGRSEEVSVLFSIYSNYLNGGDGTNQHSAHIIFTAIGGNVITIFARLIHDILQLPDPSTDPSIDPSTDLTPTNNILLQILASKSGKSVGDLCELIKEHFASDIIPVQILADSKPSDFDFKLGPNIAPGTRASTQALRQDEKAEPKTDRERERDGEDEVLTKNLINEHQFVLSRIKSSVDLRLEEEHLYKNQDEADEVLEKIEKHIAELTKNCTILVQSCNKIKKAGVNVQDTVLALVNSNFTINTINALYHRQVRDDYIRDISNIVWNTPGMSSDNKTRAKKCLELLVYYSALKYSEEMATSDNVNVITRFHGGSETEALIAHIRMYSVNANNYIKKWLNKPIHSDEFDPMDIPAIDPDKVPDIKPIYVKAHEAPALYSTTISSTSYDDVNKCFDTINDIINVNGGLILSLLSDLMHTFSTDPIYKTKPILEAIAQKYILAGEPCKLFPARMKYINSNTIFENKLIAIKKLFNDKMNDRINGNPYPPGACIMINVIQNFPDTDPTGSVGSLSPLPADPPDPPDPPEQPEPPKPVEEIYSAIKYKYDNDYIKYNAYGDYDFHDNGFHDNSFDDETIAFPTASDHGMLIDSQPYQPPFGASQGSSQHEGQSQPEVLSQSQGSSQDFLVDDMDAHGIMSRLREKKYKQQIKTTLKAKKSRKVKKSRKAKMSRKAKKSRKAKMSRKAKPRNAKMSRKAKMYKKQNMEKLNL
jgi:hypothetical protein